MNEKTISLKTSAAHPVRYLPLGALLLGLLVVIGFLVSRAVQQPGAASSGGGYISAQTLADEFGVRVNLIAVTAAGGLVDFRLKILDAEKAKLLFQDSGDAPRLLIGDGAAVLTAPEDSTSQLLGTLEDDGNVFLTFPNVGSVTKPGMSAIVEFGEIRLEPVTIK
ncbi:MAG: hypothetical protein KBE23_03625 [Chloroflexi bacterium]|nr:hypothetical protein [Chloroflexota bacterium]MBP7041803.1 hypothetical protein [Chloroflexota bacterium]